MYKLIFFLLFLVTLGSGCSSGTTSPTDLAAVGPDMTAGQLGCAGLRVCGGQCEGNSGTCDQTCLDCRQACLNRTTARGRSGGTGEHDD